MVAVLYVPHLPSLVFEIERRIERNRRERNPEATTQTAPFIVHSNGTVVSPPELSGTPLHRATQLHPSYEVVHRKEHAETAVWEMIVDAVYTTTPNIEVVREGMLLCSPHIMPRLRTIIERSGAQTGIAPSATLATMAAITASRGTIVTVAASDQLLFLQRFTVELLLHMPGISITHQMIERLQLFGFTNVAMLARLTKQQLSAQFGSTGLAIHAMMLGIQHHTSVALYEPPPTICMRERFSDATCEPAILEAAIDMMMPMMMQCLEQRRVGRIEVQLLNRADKCTRHNSRILQQPTCNARTIRTQLSMMLNELTSTKHTVWGITLIFASLRAPLTTQLQLFTKRATASDVAAPIAKRYPSAIKRIELHNPFSYMPNEVYTIV